MRKNTQQTAMSKAAIPDDITPEARHACQPGVNSNSPGLSARLLALLGVIPSATRHTTPKTPKDQAGCLWKSAEQCVPVTGIKPTAFLVEPRVFCLCQLENRDIAIGILP
jgi:hypothetical protein